MTEALRRLGARLRCERGFTVIEMLVASAIGIVVILFLLNMLEASQATTLRIVARVDGTQQGRTAMEQVTQRLRSQTCVGVTPPFIVGDVSSPTDANSVTFYSDLGSGGDFVPEKRRIYVSGGDIHETVTPGVGNPPGTTFPGPSRDRIILKKVKQVTQGATTLPYFRYFAFDANTPPTPSVEVKPPLTSADPSRIVQVVVAFRANAGKEDRVDTNFVNEVTSRMANPGNTDSAKRGPQCG